MHQQTSKKIIVYLFFFLSLVTINSNKIFNEFYKIKEFNINGLDELEIKRIYDELKIFKDKNIFFFDKKSILEKINSDKVIEKIEIFKKYPSTLNISIEKTKLLAITNKNNSNYLIGSNGNLIEINENSFEFPYIFGNVDVKEFLEFKKIIDDSNFKFNEIKEFYFFKSKRWDVVTKDDFILKMPSNLTAKKLDLIFEIILSNKFNHKMLDFRQDGMIFINE